MAIDVSQVKTGKLPATRNKALPALGDYLHAPSLPPIPAKVNWSSGVVYQMDDNDRFGDCVEVAYANQLRTWTKKASMTEADISVTSVLDAYHDLTGFDPVTGANDNGTNMDQAVQYWVKTGMAGHKVGAVARVNPVNELQVNASIALLGGLYIGLNLPLRAQSQVGGTWALSPAGTPGTQPGSWGGHCVILVDYDEQFLWAVTWGTLQRMTWNWFRTYCDEAFALLSHDWIEASELAPSGLAWAALLADMAAL